MKKFLLSILSVVLILNGCSKAETDDSKVTEVDFRLDQIVLRLGGEMGNLLEFDVYLDRPDLGLKQPKQEEQDLLTVDLPLGIQPKLMYLSDVSDTNPDTGSMCDRPRFPHRCSITLEEEKPVNTFLLKITFEDGSYIAKEISIATPDGVDKPEITAPTAAPVQGTAFEMQFKDVGADKYEIAANLCRPYNDDGINPCLDGVEYTLEREGENLKILYGGELFTPEIELVDGVVSLKSDFPIYFEESVGYTVTAIQSFENEQGVKIYTESGDLKSFSK